MYAYGYDLYTYIYTYIQTHISLKMRNIFIFLGNSIKNFLKITTICVYWYVYMYIHSLIYILID